MIVSGKSTAFALPKFRVLDGIKNIPKFQNTSKKKKEKR